MRKRRVLALASAAAVLAVVAGSAIAGHMTSGVKSYTGCLTPGEGALIKIKEGNAPSSACTGGAVQVHFSGGDLTAISAQAGGGLTGGGENGAVSLSIRRDCGSGQVVKWNGSAWACADDSNSTYTAGTGLDLSSGNEFSVEEGYRLPQNCASGEAAVRNPAVGGGASTWTCEQFATADQACTSGQFASGITAVSALSCAAAGGGAAQLFEAKQSESAGIPDDGVTRTYLSLNVPAGAYILFSSGLLTSEDNFDDGSSAHCFDSAEVGFVDVTSAEALGSDWDGVGFVKTTGQPFTIDCRATDGADGAGIQAASLVAVKVG
jgi:hypothetical protein